jgi:hypothetical protein
MPRYCIAIDLCYYLHCHRLRCTSNIINLVAQAFLFSTNKDALSEKNNQNTSYLPAELEMENWRQKGPLRELHNIVMYIQLSPQRIAAFLKLGRERD